MKLNLADFAAELTAGRGRLQELSPGARAAICTLVAAGQSERAVSRLFRVSRDTVARCVEHWKTHRTFDSRPRKGRPPVLTRREKRYIVLLVKKNRTIAKKALVNATGKVVSYSTIRRCLRSHHIRKWRAMKRIPLTKEVAKDRYNFACDWLENIDEFLQKFDKRFVNLQNHVKANISIMLWGMVWKGGRSDLIVMERDEDAPRRGYTARSYQKALQEGLLPHYNDTRHFQQDNAKIHVCKATEEWLQTRGISWIEWPAHSPDLNPIEHVWAALKKNLRTLFPELWCLKQNCVDIAKFKECLHTAWEAIPQSFIDKLIEGMPRRLAAVKKARGWYTKY
ncbi:hypothetical protein CHGG_07812 [Chaetomium globosum CBS 148.51]|uniref:Tc1-like transposase DDE domain-containing protein n=1 Tax=Chaetomium globosum (strain ATCC 6205 / CBS 148.51 / DSM 1962 / NBRC 6347 / NRRL 1970) TaxID=306901 RepID=Q2GP59_CHAGB|nr:uncharacterized protein CHGG_07812 [Chaetomium globosum CBS 148.51]XP_001228172.1 uncharacterized protein CHGG_10245 [Chaetomium globosum CBS 148.51]EAQ83841.1 hypothetical protein CHGG_10245 [Chaetomium globosum CBS 148.51]EAQ86559.1 hypothetical protein CHGG_07812 [Chaetomium globosum CBS 148.51]